MQILSVSEFVNYLNETFRAIWDPYQAGVEGEVSEFRVSQGQWVNFNLKDEASMVSCFMVLRNLNVPIEDGMRIRVYGSPRVYPKWGKLSFNADRIEPIGEGSLRRALQLLRTKLEAEGLFDASRKRTLPRFPKKIALIASKTSAAYGDFIRIINERWSGLEIDLYHVVVQGDRAPKTIMRALEAAQTGSYDAIVITRGGGAFEELMAFNDETLVRAIYASKVPTLVAIGHERDKTLAEEVADIRGSTPTDCARILVPDKRDVLYELSALEGAAAAGVKALIDEAHTRVQRSLEGSLHWISSVKLRVEQRTNETEEAWRRWFEGLRTRMDSITRLIRSVDPKTVLKRGYAMIMDKKGKVKTDVVSMKAGDVVSIRLHDGSRDATILPTNQTLF